MAETEPSPRPIGVKARGWRARVGAVALPALLGLASLAFYTPRVCPGVVFDAESPDLVVSAVHWGVPEPPGHPLGTLLVHVVTRVPFGDVVLRANFSSALFHAATVGVVAAIVLEMWGSAAAAVAAAGTLALSRAFAISSLFAEVSPLTDLFHAVLLLLALRVARLAAGVERRLVHLAVAIGIASTHQASIVFMAAGGILWLAGPAAWRAARVRPRLWLELAACIALPLAAGEALVWIAAARHPAVAWADVLALGAPVARLQAFSRLISRDLGRPIVWMSLAGLAVTVARSRRAGIGVLLFWVVAGPVSALVFPYFDRTSELHLAIAQRLVTPCEIVFTVALSGLFAAFEAQIARQGLRPLAHAATAVPLALLGPDAWFLGMQGDTRGPAFAADFVRGLPENALVLMSGDVYRQAAAYACAMQMGCGRRIFLTPGEMFMPWYAGPRLREHPELFAGIERPIGQRSVHHIAANALPVRPVFVVPSLLERNPSLLEDYKALPHGLLFELYPDAAARELELPSAVAASEALARGEMLEGLTDGSPPIDYPSLEVRVPLAYNAPLLAYAALLEGPGPADAMGMLRLRAYAMRRAGRWRAP